MAARGSRMRAARFASGAGRVAPERPEKPTVATTQWPGQALDAPQAWVWRVVADGRRLATISCMTQSIVG